jgi:hypothetical protein
VKFGVNFRRKNVKTIGIKILKKSLFHDPTKGFLKNRNGFWFGMVFCSKFALIHDRKFKASLYMFQQHFGSIK